MIEIIEMREPGIKHVIEAYKQPEGDKWPIWEGIIDHKTTREIIAKTIQLCPYEVDFDLFMCADENDEPYVYVIAEIIDRHSDPVFNEIMRRNLIDYIRYSFIEAAQ